MQLKFYYSLLLFLMLGNICAYSDGKGTILKHTEFIINSVAKGVTTAEAVSHVREFFVISVVS